MGDHNGLKQIDFLTLQMAAKTGFTPWLSEYLDTIGMDGDVYGEYIASCLHGLKESTEEERMEAVMEFVSGVLVCVSPSP